MIAARFKRTRYNAVSPFYSYKNDSGFDLCAATDAEVVVFPGDHVRIGTGLIFELPDGYELQIRPRSGLMNDTGLMAGFGTVDNGYRGEVEVILFNHGRTPVYVNPGDRIAQGVIAPVAKALFTESIYLSDSDRMTSGFGSTGVGINVKQTT